MKRFPSLALVVLFVLSMLVSLAPPVQAASSPSPSSARPLPTVARRAAQRVEDARLSTIAPAWRQAVLGAQTPIYRPDRAQPAYFEYGVRANDKAAGFIIVSNDTHDFPIPHWNDQGVPPTVHLLTEATRQGKEVAKYYKLDALTYAAEDASGQLIALYPPNSNLPTKIVGQNPGMLDQPPELTHELWSPSTHSDESNPKHSVTRTGPQPTGAVQLSGWQSWEAFKAGFSQSYATMLLAYQREAQNDWDVERAATESGEGIIFGQPCRPIAVVHPNPTISLSGAGAQYVSATVRQRVGLSPVIELCVLTSPPTNGEVVDLLIVSAGNTTESLRFLVLPASVAANQFTDSELAASASGSWSDWTIYAVGTSDNQRLYSQIGANTFNNGTNCASGCGATAWAMLFGWADKQAALGNPKWSGRWGIYRENGGYGDNVTAPRNMDTGVRNMTMELRNRIGTFCSAGSGATAPWTMDDAAGYLSGRSGAYIGTHYSSVGIPSAELRNYVSSSIKDHDTPAVIGTGWLTHYPLAWKYAWQDRYVLGVRQVNRDFFVNQGWGGSGDGWISAVTWFAGEIRP